jgi:hypothetical protein
MNCASSHCEELLMDGELLPYQRAELGMSPEKTAPDNTVSETTNQIVAALRPHSIPIGPYVAKIVRDGLSADPERHIAEISRVQSDLHADGWLQSLTKTIDVTDKAGCKYRITVEVLP